MRIFSRILASIATLAPLLVCGENASGQEKNPPAIAAKESSFLRLNHDDNGNATGLETSIVTFVSETNTELTVDLVGAVHIADRSYYDLLNREFQSYDVVLYELVAPEGTRVPKDAKAAPTSVVGGAQVGMKSMLGLEHQLECIDYQKENFVHADMSPEEFETTMANRGESFTKMFFRMMGYGLANQNGKGSGGDLQILMALFSSDRERLLKITMAEQLSGMEGQLDAIGGPDGSTIINERNRKAFEVLKKQIDGGKKKIAVFYGAGHLPDMQVRLEKDFGLKKKSERWLVAWSLTKAEQK